MIGPAHEFKKNGAYRIGVQLRLRRACAYAQPRQSLRCSHTQNLDVVEDSDQNEDL